MTTEQIIETIVYEKDWTKKSEHLLSWMKKQEQSWKRKQAQSIRHMPAVNKSVKIKVI